MVEGEVVRRLRQRLALSQEDLAQLAHVSPNTIIRLEAGTGPARPSTIRKLAAALEVDVRELTEGSSPNQQAATDS